MHVQHIIFKPEAVKDNETTSELASNFVAALRMNGQVCGREWPQYSQGASLVMAVLTPEKNALSNKFAGMYVAVRKKSLFDAGIDIDVHHVAKDTGGALVCKCRKSSAYVLYTHFLSLEPPVRCLDCFGIKPLYRLAPMADGEFYSVISWASNYQSCDSLQMNCIVLEKSTTREISAVESQLSLRGIELCKQLSKLNKTPFYYYLYRGGNRSAKQELARTCPSCNRNWVSKKETHGLFHFRCVRCKLVSNWAWGVPT
jgi:predicted  nucleic acid-binding Zn ribbon protein